MYSTDAMVDLLSDSLVAAARLIADFDAAPSPSGLFSVNAIAEVVVLGGATPGLAPISQILCDAAARWMRSGVLEELCFARVELTYCTALLAYLARRGHGYSDRDIAPLKRLVEARLIGRSEMPVLTQQLVAAYLTRCGIDSDFGDTGRRDLATLVDKRVLRARSDEYDLQVLLMCAQLLQLEPAAERPSLFPRVMLAQALRTDNINWLPVLTYLCAKSFTLEPELRDAALQRMTEILPISELLPPPQGMGLDTEYIERAAVGLRIRSTVALALSLDSLGDSYAEDRACVAVG